MAVTWDELDRATEKTMNNKISWDPADIDKTDEIFRSLIFGQEDDTQSDSHLLESGQTFMETCYNLNRLTLNKISQNDADKFLRGKPNLSREEIINRLPSWLHDLIDAFLPKIADDLPPHRAWDHKIELVPGKEPPYHKNRPLSVHELSVVRRWLDDNLSKGFIRESRARCAAPLLLAAKPGGGVRVCQDYRGLNKVTIKNRYPLPLIRETLDAICHAKFFTKLDIISAFNKLRIAEGHEWKTAFITRFGLYESLVMPFGLCNAPASFQNYINHTLYDLLDKVCTAYLDDVLIFSKTKKEHKEHVRMVVSRLRDAGLQIDINKCEFETSRTKYLGLIGTHNEIEMDPDKVIAITSWEPPKKIVLETDASDWASGGVLSQYNDEGLLRPVACFSSKHTPAECNYEIYDKELFAIIKCLEEWRPELQGTREPFDIYDNENPKSETSQKAVRPDALSRKREDKPEGLDINDDRIKNRKRIVLDEINFDPKVFRDLNIFKETSNIDSTNLHCENSKISALSINNIQAIDRPIDDLVDEAYKRNNFAKSMVSCLKDSKCQQWPKEIGSILRIAFSDCKVVQNRVYYRDRLFIPQDDELR
ncbi:hypothetical protein K3495_g14408, partial [Podosphaera aphanis]